MTDYGFRISIDGVDVKTGNDENMVITSKYPVLKGTLSGGGTTSVTSGVLRTVTVAHNLGYIPFASSYMYVEDYGFWWMTPLGFDGASGHLYLRSYCNDTNFYLVIDYEHLSVSSISVDYKYFIYLDKGKL